MSTHYWKRAISTIVAMIFLAVGASASAQEYLVAGSDTLFDVMTEAMMLYMYEVKPSPHGSTSITYAGGGSNQAELAMAYHTVRFGEWFQRIAPMSRNMTEMAISDCEARVGAGLCRAELKNVLGLDAVVLIESRGAFTNCHNIQLGEDYTNPGTAPWGNLLQLILGGKSGAGDWKACASPERVAAIQSLLDCNVGLAALTHWYRPDESSGASDTMREKLKVLRFCNGKGNPAPGTTPLNLQNPDNDPIRTDCPASSPSRKAVRCTITDPSAANYLSDCSTTPNANGCTAGFLVSISERDSAAVTMSIAARVLADITTVGYAGRESVRRAPVTGQPAFGPSINTITPSNSNVRTDRYMLSRRLWLHDTVDQNDVPVTTNSTRDAVRDYYEAGFFDWATSPLGIVSVNPGRNNMDPIMAKWGFIPCTDDFSQPSGQGNLCSKDYGPNGFPAGFGAANRCVVNTVSGSAYQPTIAATATDICCSDGLVANTHTGNTCPVPAKRAAGFACKYNQDCASGSCDGFASGSTGACL